MVGWDLNHNGNIMRHWLGTPFFKSRGNLHISVIMVILNDLPANFCKIFVSSSGKRTDDIFVMVNIGYPVPLFVGSYLDIHHKSLFLYFWNQLGKPRTSTMIANLRYPSNMTRIMPLCHSPRLTAWNFILSGQVWGDDKCVWHHHWGAKGPHKFPKVSSLFILSFMFYVLRDEPWKRFEATNQWPTILINFSKS